MNPDILTSKTVEETGKLQQTNRLKKYRDQLIDVVITQHLLNSKQHGTEPRCPSPKTLLKQPTNPIRILQRPKQTQTVDNLKQPNQPSNRKSLAQRQAEYAQYRAKVFGYKLQPGVFHASFFPP